MGADDGAQWFDTSSYEAAFARPSAVGIRRRQPSQDDMAVMNFSITNGVAHLPSGGRRVGGSARRFPNARQVCAVQDLQSQLSPHAPQTVASRGIEALRAGVQQVSLERPPTLRDHGAVVD